VATDLDPAHPVGALVCAAGPEVVGFATYVVHPHTFSSRTVGYLEDLRVEPAVRGRELGWRRPYWHCDADNMAARGLYDLVTRRTKHVRYDIALT